MTVAVYLAVQVAPRRKEASTVSVDTDRDMHSTFATTQTLTPPFSLLANLGVRLDLKKIALKCRNTEFNPRRFGAVIMRLREPRATALIFASGKMCVTGVKSTHNANLAAKKFAYIVERVGFTPQDYVRSIMLCLSPSVCGNRVSPIFS